MKVVAFVGPSLPAADRARFAGVDWRPPAQAGDLLLLGGGAGLIVCLIDGFFDHRPAVRHKEILLLLSEGARIFGASSMGALRAAEMADFGMIGIGAVYRAYAAGRIVGDDEVALVHADAERDWRPLSLPLVDLRATLCAGLRHRLLTPAEARVLLAAAAAVHYADRSWEEIAAAAGPEAGARLAALREIHVAQKRLDAAACLEAAFGRPANAPTPPPQPVRTAFLRALARERGVDLERRARGRGDRAAARAGSRTETDGDRAPTA